MPVTSCAHTKTSGHATSLEDTSDKSPCMITGSFLHVPRRGRKSKGGAKAVLPCEFLRERCLGLVTVLPSRDDSELPTLERHELNVHTRSTLHEGHPATKLMTQHLQELDFSRHHPLVELREYIISERFIWDDLILRSETLVKKVREQWQKTRTVPRMLISFPARHLPVGDKIITDVVSFAVPKEMATFRAAVELAKTTQAYALLLVERVNDDVHIVLESHHGTRSWRMPLRRHGDVTVLEKGEATTNVDSIGVLWRPHQKNPVE